MLLFLLWQHLIGELAALLKLLDVGHRGAADIFQSLLCEEGRVRADKDIGVGLQQLELLVPGLIALAGAD